MDPPRCAVAVVDLPLKRNTGNTGDHEMNSQAKELAADVNFAELTFLLQARIDPHSEETANALYRLAGLVGALIEFADEEDLATKEEVSKMMDDISQFTKQSLAQLRHQYHVMERFASGRMVADLKQSIRVVSFHGVTVFCHGKIDWRRMVVVKGTQLDGTPAQHSYLAMQNESWVSVVMKVVPMFRDSAEMIVTDLIGAE